MRSDKIFVHIEPEFAEAFRLLAVKRSCSVSDLGRIIFLRELGENGMVPEDVVKWLANSNVS